MELEDEVFGKCIIITNKNQPKLNHRQKIGKKMNQSVSQSRRGQSRAAVGKKVMMQSLVQNKKLKEILSEWAGSFFFLKKYWTLCVYYKSSCEEYSTSRRINV